MPYVVVPQPDAASRRTLADERWAALAAGGGASAAAVSLQRQLIESVLDTTEALEQRPLPRLSLPPRYVTTKLRSGIPALVGEPIQPPVAMLRPGLLELARLLASTGGDAAVPVHTALSTGRLDAGALLTLALRRDQAAIRAVSTRLSLGHDLVWLVADLAASPYAHLLLRSLFDSTPADSPIRLQLDAWPHGYCPLCGSWPSFVEGAHGRRRLRCSFCAAAWEMPKQCCVYCGAADDRFSTTMGDPSRPGRGIELCHACRGYAKVVDVGDPTPFPLLSIADIGSMELDVAAMQKGCGRPAAKTFARR